MIKLCFFILSLSAPFALSLNNSQTFGLYATKGEALELLKLETQVTAEGPYAEIQYNFLYKNSLNNTVQTKFLFPPTEDAVFHKFKAITQNQTITAKIAENHVSYFQSTQGRNNSDDSNDVLSIPANQTVEILFSIIQPLKILADRFFEVKLPAFSNDSHPTLQHWHLKLELRSTRPFQILNNKTRSEIFERSSSNEKYQAFWNTTIAPNESFVILFGGLYSRHHFILATHPQDPNDHVLLLNDMPDRDFLGNRITQDFYQNRIPDPLEMKSIELKENLWECGVPCLFIIDRSDSMRGSKIESLKQKLKTLVQKFAPHFYDADYDILSFGSTFELYSKSQDDSDGDSDVERWIETIEADMGGSDLLKALEYISNPKDFKFWWKYCGGGTAIILTDGDISYPDEVIKYRDHISAIVAIGDDASNEKVKYLARADGGQIKIVQAHDNLEEKLSELLEASYTKMKYNFAFSIECWDSQNQLIYREKRDIQNNPIQGDFLRKWIYLPNRPNLSFCDGDTGNSREDFPRYDRSGPTLNTSWDGKAEDTEIWHKVAYDAKIKELQENFTKRSPNEQEATKKKIINLSLHYQVLSPFTSFALQTNSTSTEVNLSSDFFDLSNFNKPLQPPQDEITFVPPENYLPLDSIQSAEKQLNETALLNKTESIDL